MTTPDQAAPKPSLQSAPKPMGWLVGVAVLCITLGVIAGLIGIAIVAKRKQRYRIIPPAPPAASAVRPGEFLALDHPIQIQMSAGILPRWLRSSRGHA
jgi:hypothetical protein